MEPKVGEQGPMSSPSASAQLQLPRTLHFEDVSGEVGACFLLQPSTVGRPLHAAAAARKSAWEGLCTLLSFLALGLMTDASKQGSLAHKPTRYAPPAVPPSTLRQRQAPLQSSAVGTEKRAAVASSPLAAWDAAGLQAARRSAGGVLEELLPFSFPCFPWFCIAAVFCAAARGGRAGPAWAELSPATTDKALQCFFITARFVGHM